MSRPERKPITTRSILIGLACASIICGLAFLNDRVLRQTPLVGNNLPVSVYGVLIVFIAFINPLLKRFSLSARELTVVLAITLAGCCLPGAGLLHTFTSSLVMPHRFQQMKPSWQKYDVVNMAPKKLLADPDAAPNDAVLGGFVQGASDKEAFRLSDVPWSGWVTTFSVWIPMLLTLWGGLICLALLLHKQWSSHELLSYPIADFTSALLPQEDGKSSLLTNRGFWVAGGIVILLYLNNYAATWFPGKMVSISTRFDFRPLMELVPVFKRAGAGRLFHPQICFIVVGIAFLVPKDISFSFGIGPFLWAIVVGTLALYGVNISSAIEGKSTYFGLTPGNFALFGANVGVLLTMIYTGRRYYLAVMQRTLGFKAKDDISQTIVFGARLFLSLIALFIVQLCMVGIPLHMAVLQTAIILIFYIVMSRLIAETGLFYIQPYFAPCAVLWGMFGAGAITPRVLLIMQIVTMVIMVDPKESLMPFMTNSLRLLEKQHAKLGRTSIFCMGAIVVGLAIALPTTMYFQYKHGSHLWTHWHEQYVPQLPFDNAVHTKQKLAAQGALADVETASFIQRIGKIRANPTCMWAAFLGLAIVLAVGAARLRFTWWPIHPLLFVTWSTYPMTLTCASFLFGWTIKACVTKYGGSAAVNKIKPIIIGLIAGEILAALLPSVISAVYFMATGDQPPRFRVLP